MPLIAAVTCLLLLEFLVFGMLTGKARIDYGIKAPATTGNEIFERYYRVQQNTLEQLLLLLPAMWIFALYVHMETAAGLGLVFFIGRIIYCRAYIENPAARGPGFMIGALAGMILLLGGLIGAVLQLF
jgi:uncharacterized MAPEG superfamily protein